MGEIIHHPHRQPSKKKTKSCHRFCYLHSTLLHNTSAAKSLQLCPTLCDPIDGSPPGSPSLGFSRQEHWSGLPFPSPMHESEKWKWSRSVVSNSSRPHGLQPTRLLHPGDSPGKSTGVGCHCPLHNTLIDKTESERSKCLWGGSWSVNQYLLVDFFKKQVKGPQCKPMLLYDYETWICCKHSVCTLKGHLNIKWWDRTNILGSHEAVILLTGKQYFSQLFLL